jgi:apolipoprotein N-acyltransferase
MRVRFRGFLHPARPAFGVLLIAFAAGAMVAAGQAPLGLWWIALPALAVVTERVSATTGVAGAVWTGWAAGIGYFAASLFWIVEPFLVDAARFGWMAPFALVFLSGGMALFWALAGAVAALGQSRAWRVMGFAVGLAAADLLRSYVLTGFPWALVGHVWIGTPVMQAAAFIGPVGLTLLTTLAVALPVAVAGPGARGAGALAAALVLGGVWAGGQARLNAPDAPRPVPIHVRLVQPNATQALKWQDGMWQVFLDRQMAASALPADPPLDLIVWPETAVPFLLDRTGSLFPDMATSAGGVPIALGIQRAEGARYFNSLAVIDGKGAVTDIYDKWHLVPFGEYIPLGDLAARFGIHAFAATEGFGYTPGSGPRVLDLGKAGKVLPLICYEAVFPQDLAGAPERADWVLQITNDGWFGNIAGPYQHLAQARLRAVEQGLPVLRAANTGVSAVIDAKGRVLASVPLNTEGHLDASVPPAMPPTVYARTGDWPATVLLSLSVLVVIIRRRGVGH